MPLTKNRTAIFLELKNLFKQKKWIAFYALALPQVEGLFTEMVNASKNNLAGINSLPSKVNAIRPDYFLSYAYFDYYEYYLPEERNSFSHTGFTEDSKLKAYDLLTDLEHILHIFSSLENPFVKISKMISQKDTKHFSDDQKVVSFFNLLNQLTKKQIEKIEPKIKDFINVFIRAECSVDKILDESLTKFEITLVKLQNEIKEWFKSGNSQEDFLKIKNSTLNKEPKDQKTIESVNGYIKENCSTPFKLDH